MDSDTDVTGTQPKRPRLGGLSRRGALIATTLGLATGGFAGGYLVSHAATNGSSSSSTSSGSSGSGSSTTTPSGGTAPSGAFKPNEDPTHEAGESAAREAQENAGQVPTVP